MLLFTLRFMVFYFVLQIAVTALMEGSRARVVLHKQKTASRYLAESGIEYARHVLKSPQGRSHDRFEMTSPDLDGDGRFTTTVIKVAPGSYRVTSTGFASSGTPHTLTSEIRVPR
jgi:hypothetical protein